MYSSLGTEFKKKKWTDRSQVDILTYSYQFSEVLSRYQVHRCD